MTTNDQRRAQQWGGLCLGAVFVAIGISIGVADQWTPLALVMTVAGSLIVVGQAAWIFVTRRAGRLPRTERRHGASRS